MNQNCDLVEIGKPFAVQPLALAVREGSPLKHQLSKIVLELSKDR